MLFPPSTESSHPKVAADGALVMLQHDRLIGSMLVAIWSFGPLYRLFVERLQQPSSAYGWGWLASPFLIAGIWKLTLRREFRFTPGELCVRGFSLSRGSWTSTYKRSDLKLRIEKRFVGSRGARWLWFVRLRGPDFDVALDGLLSNEEAERRLDWYSKNLCTDSPKR